MALRKTLQKSDALVRQLLAPLKMPSQNTRQLQLPSTPKPVVHPDFKINTGSVTLFPRSALAEQHHNNGGKKPPEDLLRWITTPRI